MGSDNTPIGAVHHRMPLMLTTPELRAKWLDPKAKFSSCLEIIEKTGFIQSVELIKVSTQVSSIRNQGIECALPKLEYDKL